MRIDEILQQPSMPICSPSYPKGPYRFINREYFVITYETDPEAIRAAVPEPLEPDGSNTVSYEFLAMPDSSFGDYHESGLVIPCIYKGEKVNFTAEMYLDCESPIAGGREIWGFPKKLAKPSLEIKGATLVGKLEMSDQLVAFGTMGYKNYNLINNSDGSKSENIEKILKLLSKTQVNLKLIPDIDGSLAIAQLVAFNCEDIEIKGAWQSPAKLHLVPHRGAPVADLPVKKVIRGLHVIADLTLAYGRVMYDYLEKKK
jgi:acetoacetate decarboxylase